MGRATPHPLGHGDAMHATRLFAREVRNTVLLYGWGRAAPRLLAAGM